MDQAAAIFCETEEKEVTADPVKREAESRVGRSR
jgi:hypothetical protein